MSDGHLYLSARGGADYAEAGDGRHAWFDATHQSVLLLDAQSLALRQLPLDASLDPVQAATAGPTPAHNVATLYDFSEPDAARNPAPIVLMQLSVDGQFLAMQHSDIEVQVLHRASRASYWVLCKSKAGNRILHGGVVWNTHSVKPTSSQDLFLVTKMGLEHHRVSSKRRKCALHRTVGLYVHEFWYAASHGVLLLSSGSRANEIVPFLLHGAYVEKLPKLVFSTAVSKQDLHLVSLYGDMYVVYSDTRSTKLLLYLVGRTKVTCVRSLNLMLPPGTALEYSVVDNLLVCHSLDFNVSLFFDIKCDGNISDPFSAPLPISARPPGHPPPKAKQVPEAITAPLKTADAMLNEFDSELLEVVEDENDPDRLSNTMWGSPQPTLGIRRVLSVDDLDVHSYIDDASLPSPSFKTSPASHLASRRSARRLQRAMSAASLEKPLKQEVVVPSFSRWRFHSPNLVQRSFAVNGREQVEIRKLQVNLTEVYKTCEHHREILPFILRRGDHELAKSLVLKLVRSHIVDQQASLSDIVQLLTTVQTVYGSERRNQNVVDSEDESRGASSGDPTKPGQNPAEQALGRIKASPPARNARGFLLIRQAEFYRDVWSVILQDPNTAKSCNLSAYIIEYIKNLRDNKVPVENITYVAVAECFVATGDPGKLYQFLHYHVLTDSVKLAELMVRHGCAYPALMQVGLDMYFRLREFCPLVRTLLDLGQAGRAIEIAWRNMGLTSCDAAVLPGVVFFDSLVKSVTSSKQRSSLQVAQMMGNLLLFLKVWDPACLQCPNTSSLSTLASCATVQFPDDRIPVSCRKSLREAFGFATDEN